jgi:hypothetical protein
MPREPQASDNDFTVVFRRVSARDAAPSEPPRARLDTVHISVQSLLARMTLLLTLGCALGVALETFVRHALAPPDPAPRSRVVPQSPSTDVSPPRRRH